MSQFSDKLLRYMVAEYYATGNNHFDYVNMLNCISDKDQLGRAIETLEEYDIIEGDYVSGFKILKFPD